MSIQHLINAHVPETKEVVFGIKDEQGNLVEEQFKVVYIAAPVQLSRDKAIELLHLFENSIKFKAVDSGFDENGKPKKGLDFDFDITKIITNLNSPTIKNIEQFIIKNCKMYLYDNGEWLQVDTSKKIEVDYVFTRHPDQLINFLVSGVKFHFAKHLPSGNGLLTNLANRIKNKMLLDQLAANSK